jgi:hypothetical protein
MHKKVNRGKISYKKRPKKVKKIINVSVFKLFFKKNSTL